MGSAEAPVDVLKPISAEVMEELLTVTEVARYLRVKPWTIYTWAEQGRIPAIKVAARRWRFRRSTINAWLDHHSNQRGPSS